MNSSNFHRPGSVIDSPEFDFFLEDATCPDSKSFLTPYPPPCNGRKAEIRACNQYSYNHWQDAGLETYEFPPTVNQPTAIGDISLSHDFNYDTSSHYLSPNWAPDLVGSNDTAPPSELAYHNFNGACHYTYGEQYWPTDLGIDSPSSRRSSASDISSCSSSPSYSQFVQVLPAQSKTRAGSPTNSDCSAQNARRRFPCLLPECGRRFTSQYTLKVHMEAHKPKPRVSFPCTLGCSERFSRQHDRLRHEVAKHNKVCEFLCDECGRFFSTQKTLSNHKCPMAQGGTRWIHTN